MAPNAFKVKTIWMRSRFLFSQKLERATQFIVRQEPAAIM